MVGELEQQAESQFQKPEGGIGVEGGRSPARSGSETLAASGSLDEGRGSAGVEEEGGEGEVRLERTDIEKAKTAPPALHVQEPTPEASDEDRKVGIAHHEAKTQR